MNKESIVLGSGDLYCTEFEGTDKELPTNEALETAWAISKAVLKSNMHRLSMKPKTIWERFPRSS